MFFADLRYFDQKETSNEYRSYLVRSINWYSFHQIGLKIHFHGFLTSYNFECSQSIRTKISLEHFIKIHFRFFCNFEILGLFWQKLQQLFHQIYQGSFPTQFRLNEYMRSKLCYPLIYFCLNMFRRRRSLNIQIQNPVLEKYLSVINQYSFC